MALACALLSVLLFSQQQDFQAEGLKALDAKTGSLIPSFGKNGVVDLKEDFDQDLSRFALPDADALTIADVGLHATPIVAGNIVIVGAAGREGTTPVVMDNVKGYVRAFDVKTGKQTQVLTIPDKFANWEMSPDGSYFFYQTAGNDPRIFRMRIKDRKVEEVASLKDFRPVQDPYIGNTQLNVGPDNSPLLTRDIGTQEVYALTVKWP